MAKAVLVLKVKTGRTRYEIYTLNKGDTLIPFGNLRNGLVAENTASIVVREISSLGHRDVEYDIDSRNVWGWLETLIKLGANEGVEAECPIEEEKDKK